MTQSQTNTDTTRYGNTLSAFFDDRDDAEEAVEELRGIGIDSASIRLTEGRSGSTPTREQHRGFFDALADFFMPNEDRYTYAEGLNRGGYLVTVSNVPGTLYDQALGILDDEGAIDIDERAEAWRQQGWAGYTADAASGTESTATSAEAIPVVQEELRVGKRDVSHGRVRVRSYVMEEPVNEQVNLREERVVLERRPVDRELGSTEAAFEDRTIEAEERAEEAVVDKKARVVEEVALRKEADQRTETISDTVRHTEVEVEDDRANQATPDRTKRGL